MLFFHLLRDWPHGLQLEPWRGVGGPCRNGSIVDRMDPWELEDIELVMGSGFRLRLLNRIPPGQTQSARPDTMRAEAGDRAVRGTLPHP